MRSTRAGTISCCLPLRAENIRLLGWRDLDDRQREYALTFYESEVDPLLTPVTIDPSHPFPRVLNKALCLALLLRSKRGGKSAPRSSAVLGVVTVPRALPRLGAAAQRGRAPRSPSCCTSRLSRRWGRAVPWLRNLLARAPFRVTRNSNLPPAGCSKSRAASWRAFAPNCTTGARATRCEWKLRTAPPTRLSNGYAHQLLRNSTRFRVFRTKGPVNLLRLMNLY